MGAAHVALAGDTFAAGIFLSPFGVAMLGVFGLFGLFIPIILILLVANTVGGRSRASGDPSGLGLVIGLALLFAIAVGVDIVVG